MGGGGRTYDDLLLGFKTKPCWCPHSESIGFKIAPRRLMKSVPDRERKVLTEACFSLH